jgi:hypothetical protein
MQDCGLASWIKERSCDFLDFQRWRWWLDEWTGRPIAILLSLGNNRLAPERATSGGVHRDREHFLLLSGYRLMNRTTSIVIVSVPLL